ncbi:MAG TPA: type II secretion system protein GspH [Xanthomonadaceae bacterium]|nr:type II secretion system protein GspH [Xanthomonadaceae bacterium]
MKRAMRAAGFTLIEALVVVALMATAFALFAGTLLGALPGQQLRAASGQLAAEMRATRARAIATGIDQSFVIDTRTRAWRSGASDTFVEAFAPSPGTMPGASGGGVRRQGQLADTLALGATVAREEQPGPGIAAIRFFADGSSTGGRVVVRRGDAAWRVDVHWLTGAVRVERGAGAR